MLSVDVAKHYIYVRQSAESGGLAQLARALAWHARGHRFDPDILHTEVETYLKRSLTY